MARTWCLMRSWIALGAAAWLAGSGAFAPSPARAAEPPQSSAGRAAPLVVPNPHAVRDKHENSLTAGRANPRDVQPTAWIAVKGELVEGDAPAVYRLPGASTIAPAATIATELPTLESMSMPMPPIHVADARADDVTPTHEASSDPEPLMEAPSFEETDSAPSSPWPAGESAASANAGRDQRPLSQVIPNRGQRSLPQLTPQLLPAVQRGYALAQRGAMYAARAEFVQVLGRVVQAKDAAANTDAHSQSLAAGLRAIDEAEDFVPTGAGVEAEIDVRIVASSHRTPLLGESAEEVSPHEAVALYHRYAQEQLAAAVAGEQAGSMALHGLGKVAATLSQRGSGDPALVRCATTMYSAALMTCPLNHLAANELGVLLVREGRVAEAARLFEGTIDLAPSATAYHNLAVAQGKLGFHGPAAANEQESQRLAALERSQGAVSRRAGIQWVTPAQLSGVAQPGLTPTAQIPPRKKSTWEKTKEIARSLPLVGGTMTR